MKRWSWLALSLFLAARLALAAEPEMPAVDLSTKPEYWRDTRLETAIRFPGPKGLVEPLEQREPERQRGPWKGTTRYVRVADGTLLEGKELTDLLSRKTGVTIALRGDWAKELIVAPMRPIPARELMDSLTLAFHGQWFRQGKTWVLAKTAQEARLSALSEDERGLEVQKNLRGLLHSLTPEQWKLLTETDKLALTQLTASQRQSVLYDLQLAFYDPTRLHTDTPSEEALRLGKGVYLLLQGAGKATLFNIVAPVPPNIDSPPYMTTIMFIHPETGQLEWGVPPPR